MTSIFRRKGTRRGVICAILSVGFVYGQQQSEEGIPVTDPLVIAKCGRCHTSDEHGNMQHISWQRTTPEGWQDALKSMILRNGLTVTPAEARSIVKYLSDHHGLAPEEAKPVMYYPERRIHDETGMAGQNLRDACAKCHALARPLSWRRSLAEWNQLATAHVTQYQAAPNEEAVAFLGKAAPLRTPEWSAWSTLLRTRASNLTGRWLVTATVPGRGNYYGEMDVQKIGADGEFSTRVKLQSIKDGSSIVRSGRSVVYGGYAWRGRSLGSRPPSSDPDDPGSEAREVLWFAPDQSKAEGRWFWGQYQEFGFDVKLQRASSELTLMGVEGPWLKTGSQGNRIRLIGDNFPAEVSPADVDLGPGVTVRRIVSRTPIEVQVEADVRANARPGTRNVAVRRSTAAAAITVYDRVDYVKVMPESALAAFGDQKRPRGYQQFEAIGYQVGADGKRHTADDVELGPIDATWSTKIFYAAEGSRTDFVGSLSPSGLFTPAAGSPENNFDVWVIATAKSEKDKTGKPLVGKSYLVVTVPMYTFNGRRYIRDLDRWIDDGPVQVTPKGQQ